MWKRVFGAALAAASVGAVCVGPAQAVSPPSSGVVPHGCASVSSDYSVAFEPVYRKAEVRVNTDEPCTFTYADGDVFSGNGRFTVTCSTGGHYHHRDMEPPDIATPVPQPCAVGATVTLNGYHPLTGGAVVGGGLSSLPPVRTAQPAGGDFGRLCTSGSEPSATVDLREPVDRSGYLTYVGTVRCDGANVRITSLTIAPLASHPFPSAGSASCRHCVAPVSVSGTIPATAWVYDVEMHFEVARRGAPKVKGTRFGRYAVSWAGNVTSVCPGVRLWNESPDAPANVYVPTGETCPA